MSEKSFVERYEELVKENESLKLRLVAVDRQLENGWAAPRRIHLIGDYAKTFSEGIKLSQTDFVNMSRSQFKEFSEMEACKVLGLLLVNRALREGYVEIGPRLSEGTLEAQMCLVKLRP